MRFDWKGMAACAGVMLAAGLSLQVHAQSQAATPAPQASFTPAPASPAAERLYMRSLAATCAHCHGTNGHAVEGEALIKLAGQSRDYLLTQLMAFRTGDRKATIMHQITRGYSEPQLEALAAYFAAQR